MIDLDLVSEAKGRVGAILCGKYRLDSVLGLGGMATVYAATHRNGAELAIKVLHREWTGQRDLRERFLREASVANAVKHGNVVHVVDDDVASDGSVFLVMERLRGGGVEELREWRGGTLSVHAAVAIADQLLDVLDAAHVQGIVHRDIKPANLFITTRGDVKVFDFGVARTNDVQSSRLGLTGAATVLGTPTYMAPEQADPGMTDIDARTDLWSVGATLFTLLCGHTVHEGATVGEVMLKAACDNAVSLADALPNAPIAIVEVLDCALAFEKSRRWPSARAMRNALLAGYRLHFGRAPDRATLLMLVAPQKRSDGVRLPARSESRGIVMPDAQGISPTLFHVSSAPIAI